MTRQCEAGRTCANDQNLGILIHRAQSQARSTTPQKVKATVAPLPIGLKFLIAFFAFGAVVCLITLTALLFPGGTLEPMWRLKPDARIGFQAMGAFAFPLMAAVGAACALAAIGLAKRAEWGRRLAIAVLSVNLVGDCANAFARHDYRTLIGLPIGGAMILYLASKRMTSLFDRANRRRLRASLGQFAAETNLHCTPSAYAAASRA